MYVYIYINMYRSRSIVLHTDFLGSENGEIQKIPPGFLLRVVFDTGMGLPATEKGCESSQW